MNNKISKSARKIVISATILNFLSGIMYTWSIISKHLNDNFNWTSKEASLPYTIYALVFSLFMIILGRVQDKYGPEVLIKFAAIFMGVGLFFSGLIINPAWMILFSGIFVGIAVAIITACTLPPVLKWYPAHMKGRISGLTVAGVGLSSVFFSLLINQSLISFGLSKTFYYIGIFLFITIIYFSKDIKNPPLGFNPEEGEGEEKEDKKVERTVNYDWKYMIKDLEFYKLWFIMASNSAISLMILSHISNIVKVQVSWESGFIFVIIISLFNTVGRLLGGIISDFLGRTNLLKLILLLQSLNLLLFSQYKGIASIILGVGLLGLNYGSSFSVFPVPINDYYGAENFGLNYGLFFTSWGLGGFLGPLLAATSFDSKGNYNFAYLVGFFVVLLAFGLSFTIREKREV